MSHWAVRMSSVGLLFCVVITLTPTQAGADIAASVDGVAAGAEFTGTFTLQRFVSDAGRLVAQGMLTDIAGVHAVSRAAPEPVRIPATVVSRSCEMLRVDLGPIDLDLQGRPVHVNDFSVHVSDTARGPLEHSLCAVASASEDVDALLPRLNELVELIGCLMRGTQRCSGQST